MPRKKLELESPRGGSPIEMEGGRPVVPDDPIVCFIEGDGTGPDIWKAARPVIDAAVEKAFGGRKKIHWKEVAAGEKSYRLTGEYLPEKTLEELADYHVALKGPLTTPVGGGIRSLNVTLRQRLELYACVRPVMYIRGVPSPVRQPQKVDMVIFRENMEDVYAGVEWPEGSKEVDRLLKYLKRNYGVDLPSDAGIGIKPISRARTRAIVRKAIEYAVETGRSSVTLVHKGNIMKFTEGAFMQWGYELAREEFGDETIPESELRGSPPRGKVVIKDRIADAMFQQVLLRPDEYDVIATPNLNGDYLSDALAAQVGGLGMAPGANIGDTAAVFEATHGTAPKYAGKDKVNPSSLILSGAMMLDYMGWRKAGALVRKAVEKTVRGKVVTYDLARQIRGARRVSCSAFGRAVIGNM